MMDKFSPLWINEEFGVVCNRKELQEFVKMHVNQFGTPVIAVHGTVREVVWTSIGAGMYRVGTRETK
jgi:hypothetical protein